MTTRSPLCYPLSAPVGAVRGRGLLTEELLCVLQYSDETFASRFRQLRYDTWEQFRWDVALEKAAVSASDNERVEVRKLTLSH